MGPEVRHYGDPRQIATARWVALFYCITILGGTAASRRDGASSRGTLHFQNFQKRSWISGKKGEGVLNRAHRSSRMTWILFMTHDLHCWYPATRINRYLCFHIAADNILDKKHDCKYWERMIEGQMKFITFENCLTFYWKDT